MGYNVSDPDANKPPLSKPAAIGVGVGAGVVALLLLGLTAWVCMRVRKKKKAAVAAAPAVGGTQAGEKYTDSAPVAAASSTGDWTIASGQGLVPGQQQGQGQGGGPYAPPLPMQYQDRYGGQQQQQVAELQEDYGRQGEYGYQGSPSPPLGQQQQQQQQEYHQQPYSELPPHEYQGHGPRDGGGQQQGSYEGWR